MSDNVRILFINGSPRSKNNTSILVQDAIRGAKSISGVEIEVYDLAGKTFYPCKGTCSAYHRKTGRCSIQDDFASFAEAWNQADGIIYAFPIYHMSPPAGLRSLIERLGAVYFGFAHGKLERLCKSAGVICQGNTAYGGQELAMMNIISHLLLMNCVPVTGDKPHSYMGVGGQVDSYEHLQSNQLVREGAESIGRRVTQMAVILRNGIRNAPEEFKHEYGFDKSRTFFSSQKGDVVKMAE